MTPGRAYSPLVPASPSARGGADKGDGVRGYSAARLRRRVSIIRGDAADSALRVERGVRCRPIWLAYGLPPMASIRLSFDTPR